MRDLPHFLPLQLRTGPPPSHVIESPEPTEEYRARANCWAQWVAASWTRYSPKSLPAPILAHTFPPSEPPPESPLRGMRRAYLTPDVLLYGAHYVSWPQLRALFVQQAARGGSTGH